MNNTRKQAAALMAMLCAMGLQAQVLNNAQGDYRLTLNAGNNAPRSFTIGSAFSPIGFMSALNVRGDQMGGTSVTPEVFRTNAPANANTYWRMFQGGTAAGFERGQLFAEPGITHFNLNAPNGHLRLWTNTIERARLNSNVTSSMGPLNEFPNVNRDGYLLLSGVPAAFTDPACRAPFTRLHLVDQIVPGAPNNYAQQQGFRPWQRNGITLTGNNDQSYIGHRYDAVDNTDLVIQWSDNPASSPWGTDRMKFVFTTLFNAGAARGAATMNGLEAMRLFPETYEEVNVGIGDYSQAGMGDPTERVDMLDGRLRIRQLPNDPAAPTMTKFLVVDSIPGSEFGVVKWRNLPASTGGGGSGCEWGLFGGANNNNLWTATGTSTTCPNDQNLVGIGTVFPWAKLHVKVIPETGVTYGGHFQLDGVGGAAGKFEVNGPGLFNVGVDAVVTGAQSTSNYEGNCAVRGTANAFTPGYTHTNRGVNGVARAGYVMTANVALDAVAEGLPGSVINSNYGVRSVATGAGDTPNNYGGYFEGTVVEGVYNYGVYGTASGAGLDIGLFGWTPNSGQANNNWSAYLVGDAMITGGTWITSDEALKQNIVPVDAADMAASGTDATDPLNEVQLYNYEFRTEDYPQMNLPQGPQVGVIAQQFAESFPQLVRDALHPAQYDADGNEISPAVPFKAVNMGGLIPHLLLGHQRDVQRIEQLEGQMAQMAELLAMCCASGSMVQQQGTGGASERLTGVEDSAIIGNARALTIQPNPFTDHTTLYYSLERSGRMQLLANSADGKQLRVLSEAQREGGQYQHEWNTTDLSPGVYYVTLLLDGEPIVKKAVKVLR